MENQKLIDKVSKIYRDQLAKINDINTKMLITYNKLNDRNSMNNLSYKEYTSLQEQYEQLARQHKEESDIANGMSLAREELF